MNANQLRELQAPFKERYKQSPGEALITLSAKGDIDDSGLVCTVATAGESVEAGLHPATGGSGMEACSGDMLLQSLCACAGVTLRAVATALEIPIQGGSVNASGTLDMRGTLGVSGDVNVGFQNIDLSFDLKTEATEEQRTLLVKLTERYCVVFQTLANKPKLTVSHKLKSQNSGSVQPRA